MLGSMTGKRAHPTPAALLLTLLALLALATAPAAATSYILVADGPLADAAELVLRVEIEAVTTTLEGGSIHTDYHALLLETVQGEAPGPRLTLRVPGGRAPDGDRLLHIWGAPSLAVGERALVFLRRGAGGIYHFTHFMMGAFPQQGRGADAVLVRDLGSENRLPRLADRADGGREPARHVGRFAAWLRDRAAGIEREADYLVERPETPRASYTRLARDLFRWFDFDDRRRVRWHRHRDGQPGLADGGTRAFRRARLAWRRQSGVNRLRLGDGGTTASTGEFRRADFRNTILFDDRNETIGTDFSCDDGGIIAIGGFSTALTNARLFKGDFYFPIDEAEIIVNDGVGCLFASLPGAAEQVYAHELGHTLGLGHSCGDRQSPSCARSAELDDALMRAFFNDERRGAVLGADDRKGIKTLYGPEFYAAPCDLPPGHPNFCRRCGPCGEGQGNCRGRKECGGVLECGRNVGREFGFDAGTNVCVPPPA